MVFAVASSEFDIALATTVLPRSGLARLARATTSSRQVECDGPFVNFGRLESVDVDILSSVWCVDCERVFVARDDLVWSVVRPLERLALSVDTNENIFAGHEVVWDERFGWYHSSVCGLLRSKFGFELVNKCRFIRGSRLLCFLHEVSREFECCAKQKFCW